MRASYACVLISAAILAVAGCSDEEPGVPDTGGDTPVVPPSTGAPTNGGLPHSGAPKVENPIADTSSWEADPCSVISADQLAGIGLKAPTPQRDDAPDLGPGCLWEFDADSASVFSGSLGTAGARQGISNLYQHKEQGTVEVFEELQPIEGHPAVISMPTDDRSEGACDVSVGLRDDLVYTVVMTAEPSTAQGKEPCEWAEKLATLAVQTMKGAS